MAVLRARPKRATRMPGYPTRLAVLDHPALLQARQPLAWRRHEELSAVAGALLAAQLSCRQNADPPPAPAPADDVAAAIVAPLFDHGAGRSSSQLPRDLRAYFACIAVAAPTFVPEDEALRIIVDELAKYGLNLTARNVVHPEIILPSARIEWLYEWTSEQGEIRFVEEPAPFVVDLEDPQRNVAVEFVAWEDYLSLGGYLRQSERQRHSDLRDAVRVAGEAVARDGHGFHFGAFYDPVVHYEFGRGPTSYDVEKAQAESGQSEEEAAEVLWKAYVEQRDRHEVEAEDRARQLLLRQVRDFADWLEAQGVI